MTKSQECGAMKAILGTLTLIFSSALAMADVRSDLARLYPEQTPDTLKKRIEQVKSPKDFFLAFPAYFHWRMNQGPFQKAPWNQTRHRIGWCLGDPNPENFGVVMKEVSGTIQGKAAYLPVNLDDAHPCPLAADVLRFLVGWNLWAGEGGTEELLSTYLNVRRGSLPQVTPQVIALLLREAEFRGTRASLDWYQVDLGILRRRSDLAAIPAPFDREVAQAAMQVLQGKGRVIQVAERINLKGSAGGVKHFIALVDRGSEGPLLLEFRELTRPATFPWNVPLWDPFLRLKTAWNWQKKDYKSDFEETVTLYKRPYATRPLWEGQINLNLSKITSLQMREVAHFQAALLALAHRNGPGDFPIDFESIPPATWTRTVSELARDIQLAYAEITGPIERKRR